MIERLILLTGASGLVGSGLITHLLRQDRCRTVGAATRHPETLNGDVAVVPVCMDLSREDLGMDDRTKELLREKVTEIIHCAADVKFNATLQSSRSVNTEGTRRLLAFAGHCPRLKKLGHVSTMYIAGKRPGQVSERALQHNFGYFNVYEQSKHEAEEMVFSWMRRLPVSIYRLSAIVGNSVTGKISQKNFFHSLIAMAPRAAALPCLPVDPLAPVDLIADDWCCESLALLFDKHFEAGSVHHLCAGLEYSLPAGELIDTVFRVVEEQTGTRIAKPPMGSWEDIARHRASRLSCNEGALLDLIANFLPHMALRQVFERGRTGELLDRARLAPPQPNCFVERVIRETVPLSRWQSPARTASSAASTLL